MIRSNKHILLEKYISIHLHIVKVGYVALKKKIT